MRAPGLSCRVRIGRSFAFDDDEQIERHDRRVRDVGRQRVLDPELHEVLDAGGFRVGPRLLDSRRHRCRCRRRARRTSSRRRSGSARRRSRGRRRHRPFVTSASVEHALDDVLGVSGRRAPGSGGGDERQQSSESRAAIGEEPEHHRTIIRLRLSGIQPQSRSDAYGYTDVDGQTRRVTRDAGSMRDSAQKSMKKCPFLAGFSLPDADRFRYTEGTAHRSHT